ncbi:MAG: NYN domain-containing protein [Tabrizicola sp.]
MTGDTFLFLALLAAALAATFLVLWLRRPTGKRSKDGPKVWVLIDGSNVMHWRENVPDLAVVKDVARALASQGFVPGVVFDANAGWKLFGRYIHDGEFARLLGLEKRQVLVVAKGTQADPFLLQTAREFDARIVTNDRFRDWAEAHPEVQEPGFLIRGGVREGKVWLQGWTAKEAAR